MQSASAITRAVVPISSTALDTAEAPDFSARILTYGATDPYGMTWADGCLDASLDERLPVLTWAHDWADPIGHAVGWHRDGAEVIVDFTFDDVPRANQARTQLRSGTITDISVGLTAATLEFAGDSDDVSVTEGTVAECALTLRGAIAGAQVLDGSIAFDAESFRRLMATRSAAPVTPPVVTPETPTPDDVPAPSPAPEPAPDAPDDDTVERSLHRALIGHARRW